MNSNLDGRVIAIDRGATFTDFAVVESGGLKETFSLEDRSWAAIQSAYSRLKAKYQSDHIVFSGCAAVVHFNQNSAKHVGGSGVGGGTIKGLASLICGLDDPQQLDALAMQGNAANLNLTISDLGYEEISFLGADMTASNFAAPGGRNRGHHCLDLRAGVKLLRRYRYGRQGCPQRLHPADIGPGRKAVPDPVSLPG